jgi:hypothetical protein
MKQLVPTKAAHNAIPYLTPSGEGDIGVRTEVFRGTSPLSGEYIVEEVVPSLPAGARPYALRRLIFLTNRSLVR